MAKKKRKQRTRKTKRSAGKRGTPPMPLPAAPPRPTRPQLLELSTTDFDRPIVRIDGDDFDMRVPEELTFSEYARQIAIGNEITELADETIDEEVLSELQELISEQAHLLLVDLTDEVAAKLTPGLMLRIHDFFGQLVTADGAGASASGSSSSPGAKDSTGIPEAA